MRHKIVKSGCVVPYVLDSDKMPLVTFVSRKTGIETANKNLGGGNPSKFLFCPV